MFDCSLTAIRCDLEFIRIGEQKYKDERTVNNGVSATHGMTAQDLCVNTYVMRINLNVEDDLKWWTSNSNKEDLTMAEY